LFNFGLNIQLPYIKKRHTYYNKLHERNNHNRIPQLNKIIEIIHHHIIINIRQNLIHVTIRKTIQIIIRFLNGCQSVAEVVVYI
jgi:hypothetical protein